MRFCFNSTVRWYDKRLLCTICKPIATSVSFKVQYKSKDKIIVTFEDKAGNKLFDGEASVITMNSYPRFNFWSELKGLYDVRYGRVPHTFEFHETRPNHWIAKEV